MGATRPRLTRKAADDMKRTYTYFIVENDLYDANHHNLTDFNGLVFEVKFTIIEDHDYIDFHGMKNIFWEEISVLDATLHFVSYGSVISSSPNISADTCLEYFLKDNRSSIDD